MPDQRFYTITYDIPDDGRRVKVANVLKSFGERVQLSVFECWLAPQQLLQLRKLLEKKLESTQDSVRIYRSVRLTHSCSHRNKADFLLH